MNRLILSVFLAAVVAIAAFAAKPAATQSAPSTGPATDGRLEAAIELLDAKAKYKTDGQVNVRFTIKNVAKEEVVIWSRNCSWGHEVYFFEVTTASGTTFSLCEPAIPWKKNSPSPQNLSPGESFALDFDLTKLDGWKPVQGTVTVRGVYEAQNEFKGQLNWPQLHNLWGGRVVTEPVKVVFVATASAPASQPAAWTKLYADEQWYKDHKQPEQVFTGVLQRLKVETEPTTLMRSHRYQLGDRFLYPEKENADLERLVGQKVEIKGKAYDIELEGQNLKEIWPSAVRPAAPVAPPASASAPAKVVIDQSSVKALLLTLHEATLANDSKAALSCLHPLMQAVLSGMVEVDSATTHLFAVMDTKLGKAAERFKFPQFKPTPTTFPASGLEQVIVKGSVDWSKVLIEEQGDKAKISIAGVSRLATRIEGKWYLASEPVPNPEDLRQFLKEFGQWVEGLKATCERLEKGLNDGTITEENIGQEILKLREAFAKLVPAGRLMWGS